MRGGVRGSFEFSLVFAFFPSLRIEGCVASVHQAESCYRTTISNPSPAALQLYDSVLLPELSIRICIYSPLLWDSSKNGNHAHEGQEEGEGVVIVTNEIAAGIGRLG